MGSENMSEAEAPNQASETQEVSQTALAPLDENNVADTGAQKAPGKGKKAEKTEDAPADSGESDAPPSEVNYDFAIPENMAEKIKADDPVFKAMGEIAKELGVDAANMETLQKFVGGLVGKLAEQGFFEPKEPEFDTEKELEGFEKGKERQAALNAKVEALLARGEITQDEAQELASLTLTKAGIAVLEKTFGKGEWKEVSVPNTAPLSKEQAQKEWDAFFTDPKWNSDFKWMRETSSRREELRKILAG